MPPCRAAPCRPRAQAAAWRRLGYNTPGSRPSHLQHDSQAAQRAMQKGLGRGQTANPLGRPGNGNSGPKLPTRSQRRAQAKSGSAQRGHVRLLCLLDILREPRTSSVPAGLQKKTPRHAAPHGASRTPGSQSSAGGGGEGGIRGGRPSCPPPCISARCRPFVRSARAFSPARQQQVPSPARSLRSNAGTESIPRQMFLRPLTPA